MVVLTLDFLQCTIRQVFLYSDSGRSLVAMGHAM